MKKLFPFKIRPFNMANFSSGSGYLVFYYVFFMLGTYLLNVLVNIPLTVISSKLSKNQGWVKTRTIKRALNFVYVPVAIVLSVVLTFVYMWGLKFIYTDGVIATIAYAFCAASPFVIVYFAILTALIIADRKDKTKFDENGVERVKGLYVFLVSFAFVLFYSCVGFSICLMFNLLIEANS